MAVNIKEAFEIIISSISKQSYEIIEIQDASKRVIYEDFFSCSSLPKFDNSAMDGFAILLEDTNKEVKIIDTIFAGDNNTKELKIGTCIKIMTGARVPANCEAIVPKEDTKQIDENNIVLPSCIKENQHIRFIGEDIKESERLIRKNQVLNFSHVTLLASQGISHIKVLRKPKVVVFASGEELKLHYEKAEDFQIYNSNTPTFISRCKELGCDVTFIGQAKDSIDSIKESTLNSLGADLIITSGGVSVGDADFTKAAFNELDFKTLFDGIIIKPGKPTVFGKIDNTFILNLPGNPLASALIFEVFGKLIVNKLLGNKDIHYNYIEANISEDLTNKKGRETIIPGFFDGINFNVSQKRNPGMVCTLASCNAIIILDKNVSHLKKDKRVKILPISWNFFTEEKKDFLTYE